MIILRSNLLGTLLSSLSLVLMVSCSYQPEDPGQCKLVCGNAIISGNDDVVKIALKTPTTKTECAYTEAGSPTQVLRAGFVVGETIFDQNNTAVGTRPIPNISVQPLLVGPRSPSGTVNDDDFRYVGLKTLKDNWCSDSCGVVIMDVVGQCPGVGSSSDVQIQLESGALFSDPAVFNITTKEPPT